MLTYSPYSTPRYENRSRVKISPNPNSNVKAYVLVCPLTSAYVLSIPVRPRKVIRATLILVRLGIKREFTISKDVVLYVDIISIAIYSGYLFIRSEYYKSLSYILIIILLLF